MEQNQNPQQPNMQNPQDYQYNYDKNQQTNPFYQEYQQPVYASPVTVKKKVNPAVIIVPAVILAVAAVVALMILLMGKGGYRGAEERFFSQMFGGLSSAVSETEKVSKEPQSIAVSFDAANSQISDYIGISNFKLVTETAIRGEDIYSKLSFAAGDMFINGNIWYDGENSSVLMILPDISSVYIKAVLDPSQLTDNAQTTEIDSEEALKAFEDVLSQTMETYFEVVGDTGTVRNQELNVAGNTYTADKAEIRLDSVQFATVVKAFLENLVNNDEAIDILCAYYGEDKEYVTELLGISYAIEELEKVIKEGDENSEASFNMVVWMQGGNIVGREVEIVDDDGYTEAAFSFYQIPVSNGTVTYFEIPDEFKFVNEEEVKGELHSGTLTISDGYDTVKVKYDDIAITDRLFQGEARITVSGAEGFEAAVELDSAEETKTLTLSIPNVCKVTVTAEPSQLGFEDIPQPGAGEVVIIHSGDGAYDEEAMEKFIEDVYSYLLSSGILGFDFDF